MKKSIISSLLVVVFAAALFLCSTTSNVPSEEIILSEIPESEVPLSPGGEVINEQPTDINVIPDKYNTGATEPGNGFDYVAASGFFNDVKFNKKDASNYTLDFAYSNKNIQGSVLIKNLDLSSKNLTVLNETLVTRDITLEFENCVFGKFSTSKCDSKLNFVFKNCTINSFNGCNAAFDRCRFGGTCSDALTPFLNVSVNNCYICDMSHPNASGSIHTDGTQIYGKKDLDAANISYDNCRFELPQLSCATQNSYINACLMIQLEYSNADSLSFTNCRLNGGGYSIYAWDKNLGYSLSNVSFKDISVGCLRRYNQVYPKISDGVTMENVTDTAGLYASTVYRDKSSGETYISVTNDTNQERRFRVYTSSNRSYDFTIAACPLASEAGNLSFSDFPFDQLYTIPEYCDWLVCYEVTDDPKTKEETLTQIRFMNWTNDTVFLSTSAAEDAPAEDNAIADVTFPISGKCGANVTYTLTDDGTLLLSGTGNTSNYSSTRPAPWYKYKNMITSITIEPGITSVGSQLFKNCQKVTHVILPEGITIIKANAFINCKKLTELSLPASLSTIENHAFWGMNLTSVTYAGNDEQRSNLVIGDMNDDSVTALKSALPNDGLLSQGNCGRTISWTLSTDGLLTLTGSGMTYDYSSNKNAPWFEYRDSITSVVIEDGITTLGNQLFRGCKTVNSISLPSSVTALKNNVFINCSGLRSISIPSSVTTIGSYCFHGTSLETVNYDGTSEAWSTIQIGSYNAPLDNAALYTTDSDDPNLQSEQSDLSEAKAETEAE